MRQDFPNTVTELMRILNWAQLNGAPGTEAAATEGLIKIMGLVITLPSLPARQGQCVTISSSSLIQS